MIHLRDLVVKSCNRDEQAKMEALGSAPPDLQKLGLIGKLDKVPHWFNSLDSLRRLSLRGSRLRDDFLPHVQALPNLLQLQQLNAYEGERLDFLEGFQKLKILKIAACPRLKEVVITKE
ncbi:disease resistance protein RPM1-like [Hibiscus syriacus]|uniref:disease resistance protein RPM1-like n=1 Tax=Hibiscus syriacus TaxID=106335 RepID=UPI001924F699|nr:disease resistance protein RPM1-like [Hibiscus syriacus]